LFSSENTGIHRKLSEIFRPVRREGHVNSRRAIVQICPTNVWAGAYALCAWWPRSKTSATVLHIHQPRYSLDRNQHQWQAYTLRVTIGFPPR
jgi:hypothetical protein